MLGNRDRYAGYIQDIITFGRLTFNLQLRMDREIDYRKEGSFLARLRDAGKAIWNQEAYDQVAQLGRDRVGEQKHFRRQGNDGP